MMPKFTPGDIVDAFGAPFYLIDLPGLINVRDEFFYLVSFLNSQDTKLYAYYISTIDDSSELITDIFQDAFR